MLFRSPSLCIGDSVTLNATQTGTGFGVTYTWSNGLTGNSIRIPVTGSDTLTVHCESIYGCNSNDTVVITAFAAPNAGTVESVDSVICGGSGTTGLSLTGATGSSFTWYYGASATGPWTATTNQGANITTDTLTTPTYFICVAACPSATSADTSAAEIGRAHV